MCAILGTFEIVTIFHECHSINISQIHIMPDSGNSTVSKKKKKKQRQSLTMTMRKNLMGNNIAMN